MILVLLTSGTTYKCYSQKLTAPILQRINTYVAKAVECKRVSDEKSIQIDALKNLNTEQQGKIKELQDQKKLLTENNTISEGREAAALALVAKCNNDKAQAERDVVRLKKGRNRYAWIAGLETLALAAVVYFSIR